VLLAAITPSCESASAPSSAPSPQKSATATATKTGSAASAGETTGSASVTASTSPRMSRLAAPMIATLTSVCASSHSTRESGVVASFEPATVAVTGDLGADPRQRREQHDDREVAGDVVAGRLREQPAPGGLRLDQRTEDDH